MSGLKNVKLATPTYDAIVPSTGETVKIHPFKVGDEKILLIASESKDPIQMVDSLKQIIGNCVDGVNVNDLASFDLEYLFVKLRSISVGETTEVQIACNNCEEKNKVEVDLSVVEVEKNEDHTDTVKISSELVFKMKYPELKDLATVTDNVESLLDLITNSVKTVFYGEEAIDIGPAEKEDLKNIVEQLTSSQFKLVQDFFATAPKLRHSIDFTCEHCQHPNKQRLEGLASFF